MTFGTVRLNMYANSSQTPKIRYLPLIPKITNAPKTKVRNIYFFASVALFLYEARPSAVSAPNIGLMSLYRFLTHTILENQKYLLGRFAIYGGKYFHVLAYSKTFLTKVLTVVGKFTINSSRPAVRISIMA